jgi:hypothetical protein
VKHKEDDEQLAFFEWVAYQHLDNKPLSDVCWATPNGGNRDTREAARMKKQGTKSGVFDVQLAVPAGGFHGLFIEFKVGDNKMSEEQVKFKVAVTSEGYLCVVCYSCEDAIEEVTRYLRGNNSVPVARITLIHGKVSKYQAECRQMKQVFPTRRGAVGWLGRRCFNEDGERI